jgi:hypothetical protein
MRWYQNKNLFYSVGMKSVDLMFFLLIIVLHGRGYGQFQEESDPLLQA